jgi:MerR family transcriptional regulator, mercuric resistance operon regulatory protein
MYVPEYGVKSIMESMTIGQLAAAAGVNVETVRYYQRRNLLAVPEREAGSIGRYPPASLTRLRFIKRSQSLGFSLDDVQVLLSLDDGQACSSARHLGELKLAEVRDRIQTLRVLEVALQDLVSKCATAKRKVSCPLIEALTSEETGMDWKAG